MDTKIRVFYKSNGRVVVMLPVWKEKRANQTDAEFLEQETKKSKLANLPFDDIKKTDLPDIKKFEKWRGEKGKGIWVDESIITPAEKRKAKADELDAELAKDSPDPVKVIRINRELEKMKYA